MAWVKIDDGFPEHPKTLRVGSSAAWLHVCALAYCNRNETDGIIPREAVERLTDQRKPLELVPRLVDAGMWHIHPDGWEIHDYLEYQPSRAKLEEERSKARDRMRKARSGSGDVRANNERSSPNVRSTRPESVPSRTEVTTERVLSVVPTVAGTTDDDQFLRSAELVADARMAERTGLRNPARYRAKIIEQLKTDDDGNLIVGRLNMGDTPEQAAMFVLGHGSASEPAPNVPWCDENCPTCGPGGITAWIDTGNGLAPCPERRTA